MQEKPVTTPKFEYLVGWNISEADLNALGQKGWELVSVFKPSGVGYSMEFYLKRTVHDN